jgi:hypothetical protein
VPRRQSKNALYYSRAFREQQQFTKQRSIVPDNFNTAPIVFGDRTLIGLIVVPANASADVG